MPQSLCMETAVVCVIFCVLRVATPAGGWVLPTGLIRQWEEELAGLGALTAAQLQIGLVFCCMVLAWMLRSGFFGWEGCAQ